MKVELNDVIGILSDLKKREERYCYEYVKLNPTDKKRRESERDLVISTLYNVVREIEAKYGIRE